MLDIGLTTAAGSELLGSPGELRPELIELEELPNGDFAMGGKGDALPEDPGGLKTFFGETFLVEISDADLVSLGTDDVALKSSGS